MNEFAWNKNLVPNLNSQIDGKEPTVSDHVCWMDNTKSAAKAVGANWIVKAINKYMAFMYSFLLLFTLGNSGLMGLQATSHSTSS